MHGAARWRAPANGQQEVRGNTPILLCAILATVGCAQRSSAPITGLPLFDDYVTVEIRTFGRYVLADPYPAVVGPPNDVPCKIGTIFGTHFDLMVPPVEAGRFLLVTVWSRAPIDATSDSEFKQLGHRVQNFTLPFGDPSPGTYLTLTLNTGPDLVAGRYRQHVTTGSGRTLFTHEFLVRECPAA